jgi:hypothetical protein
LPIGRGASPSTAGNATIGEYLTCWLEDCVQSSVKPITYESYERLVRVHIAPALGHLKLKGLTPPHVRALYRSKLEAALSPSTVQYFRLMKSRAPEMTPGVVTEKQPSQGRDGGHHVDITSVTSRSARRRCLVHSHPFCSLVLMPVVQKPSVKAW